MGPPKPQPKPHHPLEKVHAAEDIRVGRGRARDTVKERLRKLGKYVNDDEAGTFVRKMVRGLVEEAFVRTDELQWAEADVVVLADVYGVRDGYGDWYVKLYLVEEGVIVASCHEPTGTLVRVDGTKVGKPRK